MPSRVVVPTLCGRADSVLSIMKMRKLVQTAKCPRFQRYTELRASPTTFFHYAELKSPTVHTFQRILNTHEAKVPNEEEGKEKSVARKMFFCLALLSRSPTKRLFWSKHFGGHVVHSASSLTWFFIFKIGEKSKKGIFFFSEGELEPFVLLRRMLVEELTRLGLYIFCKLSSIKSSAELLSLTREQLCISSL